jgi:hypothetical protein
MRTIIMLLTTGVATLGSSIVAVAEREAHLRFAPTAERGAYCISYSEGGSDRGFISLEQCRQTASGITAECSALVVSKRVR